MNNKRSEFIKILSNQDRTHLVKELVELERVYFSFRVKKSMQQLSDLSLLKKIRRNIARIHTILNQKKYFKKLI